jgi:hypothetical protein
MMATMRSQAASNPLYRAMLTNTEEDINLNRAKIRSCLFDLLNPNVEVPSPKLLEILKAAIKLPQYDKNREGVTVKDLAEPAANIDYDAFNPSMAYIPLRRKPFKPKKKRGENEVKLFDFVDSSKAIQGSSDEEE